MFADQLWLFYLSQMQADLNPIWHPTEQSKEQSNLKAFWDFVEQNQKQSFRDYKALHQWSVQELGEFWKGIAEFFSIDFERFPKNWVKPKIPFYKTQWLEGANISYSHHLIRNGIPKKKALIFRNEAGLEHHICWDSLLSRTYDIKLELANAGVSKGDCVVGYLTNHPDTIAAFLATNTLGGIWSCCSPDFGVQSVIDRFKQLEPKVLFAHGSYTYMGKYYDQKEKIKQLENRLSSLSKTIVFDDDLNAWELDNPKKVDLNPIAVPFDHPMWVLFSSGTTGKPKAITHRTGGMLLEQYKALALHQDVQAGEKFFWNTTTGWMMWNYALGALLCGATLCLYDGAATYPKEDAQWKFAADHQIEHFGHGAPFYIHCMKKELEGIFYTGLKTIGSTGAPLSKEAFQWLQQQFPKTHIISLSGGTDVCTAFLGGNPLEPVYAGRLQSRMLGASIEAWDSQGNRLVRKTGELVITQPMPCMPLYFWGDSDFKKYHQSYFESFPGVWAHGDYIAIDPSQGIEIFGRSDATLNRGGIRMGTAEIYSVLDGLEFLQEHLIVDIPEGSVWSGLILFVTVKSPLNNQQLEIIKSQLRQHCSPRHVPDRILEVEEIPVTISGKKMEVPVKKLFMGIPLAKAATPGAMKNPKALQAFEHLYNKGLRAT